MKRIYAFLPCYNEEQNIGALIDQWLAQRPRLDEGGWSLTVVGIDDHSTDGTRDVILQKTREYDGVILLSHETNQGLCGGLNTAISYFAGHGEAGDYMVLMDGDNTHDPVYVHDMLQKIQGGCDCVIASRYCDCSGVVGVAAHREFMSDMAKHYYRMVLRVPNVKDYTCGYRIYTYDIITRLLERFQPYPPVREKSFACMMELLYKLYIVGATFDEVGFELRYDKKQGASKMHVFTTMKNSIVTALSLRRMYKREGKR